MIAGQLANVSHITLQIELDVFLNCNLLVSGCSYLFIFMALISFVVRESLNVFCTGLGEAILKYCVAVLFLLNLQLKPTWIAFIDERY